MPRKKILFIVCTHGDELAGAELFYKYPYGRTEAVEWKVLIGNPMAHFLNLRFVEEDLDFICNTGSNSYEGRRSELLAKAMAEFDIVYDIHTTTLYQNKVIDCAFLNTLDNKADLDFIAADHIIWDSNNNNNYVTSLHPRSACLEYARTDNVADDRARILADFERIIHQEQLDKKRQLTEFVSLVRKQDVPGHTFDWENFTNISAADKALLALEAAQDYMPIFVNPDAGSEDVYACLNRYVSDTDLT